MVAEAKKKILITGINGMLGKDLSDVLREDYRCYGIDLITADNDEKDFYKYDICDIDGLKKVFDEVRPWLVIHGAAFTDVDGCEKYPEKAEAINVQGTKNIVSLCSEYKAKLIFISTDYVFDGENSQAYTVDDTPSPLNVYGHTKLAAEQAVLNGANESLVVRTSWLFGKGGKNFVKTIKEKSAHGDTLKVVNDQRGSPTHTLSLAKALMKLIKAVFFSSKQTENHGIYHISNSETCTWYEFAKKIIDLCNINVDVVAVDSTEFVRPAKRPKLSVLDNSRYEQITKHRLCSWVQALQTYLT